MPTEIQQPGTAAFVPLKGVYNFQVDPERNGLKLFHFRIDWTLSGAGQEILRESLRSDRAVCIRNGGREYCGKILMDPGFNTADGDIVVQII